MGVSRPFCKSILLSSIYPSTAASLRFPSSLRRGSFFMASLSSKNDSSSSSSECKNPQSDTPSPSSAIDFLSLCHRLKITKRTGWVRRGIENPESISDHMYRMGIMALITADIPGVNRDRCIKLAIVHDIAEGGISHAFDAIVGDIAPSDGIPKAEKSRREREALEHMCKLLGGGPRAEELSELWMEYEENLTLEAKLVKDFDKIEMILQALEYESGKFQTDVGKAWAAEIISRRRQRKVGSAE
ncbi:HD domain-containing protein 2 [Nymphaea thermarum]|nr:HD domain-containing protein 2 [Nymphaea thermarum]